MKINTVIYLVLAEQTQLDCSGAPPPAVFPLYFQRGTLPRRNRLDTERTVRNAAELCEIGPTLKSPYDHKVVLDRIKRLMADAMIDLIEEAAIPVCMVGLLYALPNTQLTRRLEKEGRLHPHPERQKVKPFPTAIRWFRS
jgi:hypothetical protein